MGTILLIDDEEQVRRLFQAILEQASYRIVTAASGNEGWRLLHEERVDLILVCLSLPDVDGLGFIHGLRTARPACKIIVTLSGSGEWSYSDIVTLLGANDVLKKPLSLQELLDAVSAQLTAQSPVAPPPAGAYNRNQIAQDGLFPSIGSKTFRAEDRGERL